MDVVVLDLDGGTMLEECLASLEAQSVPPTRVIVWDNGSKVPVTSRIREREGLEVFRCDRNLGFAAGMNAAIERASADFVALVNNDVVLEPDWLAKMTAVLGETPALAAVQSVIVGTGGLVDGAGIDLSDGTIRQRGHGQPTEALSGSAWGVSATAAVYRLEALEGVAREGRIFDELLFAYYEDVDLCARLKRSDWGMRVLDEPLAVHRGSASSNLLGRDALKLRVRNRWLVHRRHADVGRFAALLREDLTHIVRAMSRGAFGEALDRTAAVISGLTTRLER